MGGTLNQPVPLVVADSGAPGLAPSGAIPVALYGGGWGGTSGEVRHDNAGGYDYTGRADTGVSESDSGWVVTRVSMVSPPVVARASGSWDDRAILIYT